MDVIVQQYENSFAKFSHVLENRDGQTLIAVYTCLSI